MSEAPRKILVTSALPYANGPIHLGHLLEYIQTDIWVRFQKLRGEQCLYVCADDAHGTAIMLKAEEKGITPEQQIEQVKAEHERDFCRHASRLHKEDHGGSVGQGRMRRELSRRTEKARDFGRRLRARGQSKVCLMCRQQWDIDRPREPDSGGHRDGDARYDRRGAGALNVQDHIPNRDTTPGLRARTELRRTFKDGRVRRRAGAAGRPGAHAGVHGRVHGVDLVPTDHDGKVPVRHV